MKQTISFETLESVGSIALFKYKYVDKPDARYRTIDITYAENEHECIALIDAELPKSSRYEIRADGIWLDAHEQEQGRHWSFSLESFALRLDIEQYLASKQTDDVLLIGDRIPFGFELDLTEKSPGQYLLEGEILIEKSAIDIGSQQATGKIA